MVDELVILADIGRFEVGILQLRDPHREAFCGVSEEYLNTRTLCRIRSAWIYSVQNRRTG